VDTTSVIWRLHSLVSTICLRQSLQDLTNGLTEDHVRLNSLNETFLLKRPSTAYCAHY